MQLFNCFVLLFLFYIGLLLNFVILTYIILPLQSTAVMVRLILSIVCLCAHACGCGQQDTVADWPEAAEFVVR